MAALISPVSNADPLPANSAEQAPSVSSCSPNQHSLLFAGFNQDHSRFGSATARGFRVYDCRPFKAAWLRESSDGEGHGGIAFVELLFRSHICALVGGGPAPGYPPNKVMIWDDRQSCCIGELSFRSQVCSVKLRRDRIVVALECKIYVYNFADLKLLLQIDTVANPRGLCAISSTSNSVVLACPSLIKGQVRLDFQGTKKQKFVSAHDSGLACLALTLDGQFLATASSKGTLIRIFNTLNGRLLQEVRRGVDRADIFSISFSSDAQWLAVSSDRGTIHVFSLKNKDQGEEKLPRRQDSNIGLNNIPNSQDAVLSPASLNPGSTFSFIKGILPRYFSSEWSFCQFRLPEEIKSVVAFDPEEQSSIMIVGSNGSFYRCTFDPVQGGKMVQQEHVNFMKPSV